MKTILSLAAFSAAALVSGAALAQATTTSTTTVIRDPATGAPAAIGVASTTTAPPVANPPPQTTPPTTANADTGYSGNAQGPAFRDVDARIAEMEGKVHGNRRATAALSKIKGEAKYRRARHGGELRDWDRELLNKQLDQLAGMVG